MFSIDVQKIEKTSFTNKGSFLQTPFWADFKSQYGWTVFRFLISAKGEGLDYKKECSVMVRSFGKSVLRFSLAYIPLFPELPFDTSLEGKSADEQNIEFSNLVNEIAFALKPFLPKNTICVRFDPDVSFDSPSQRDFFVQGVKVVSFADNLKLCKNKVDIQPPDSTLIDLTKSEDEILSGMKTKWRYNVNLAARKGVQVQRLDGKSPELKEKLDVFYELYKITAERDGIAIHGKKYYEDLLLSSSKKIDNGEDVPVVSLYIASHDGDNLGAIITLFSKTESVYLYGCSSNVKRNLMPNFLLQWTAMKDAKAYGSSYYDMYGMPPTDDVNHPMHGLYLFKTGFGGKNIHRIGTFDVPLSFAYKPCTFIENLRAFWHKKVLKKIRGR